MTEQKWTDEVELCHCSRPVVKEHHRDYDVCMNPDTCSEEHFSRGMCKTCDMVRCDAFPGSCKPEGSYDKWQKDLPDDWDEDYITRG